MSTSFLDSVGRIHGESGYSGDEYGGATGHDGSGLPTDDPANFLFATGIECSYPVIDNGRIRRDLLEETGHYTHWQEDLHLVKELGVRALRYGLPLHKVYVGPGKFDWSFADEVMREMRRLEITPILDLMHFGVPDWIGSFQNPDLPVLFESYCEAVVRRYPWVRYWTPVNEIFVTAKYSGKMGGWNEQLQSDTAFVTVIKHAAAASILGTQAIARNRNDCIIVQSESAEYRHDACTPPRKQIDLDNRLRFLSLDLLYGHQPDADIYQYLLDNGMTRKEYDWFMAGEPPGFQIMGNDYYGRNEIIVLPDDKEIVAEDVLGWYQITHDYYARYKKPVMHTETNHFDPDFAPTWMWKQWMNILQMRRAGVPVMGFTWYSLIDQIDWDVALVQKNNKTNACGLFDLQRKPRPVRAAFRRLLETFGQITVVPHGEIFVIGSNPASLKVEV